MGYFYVKKTGSNANDGRDPSRSLLTIQEAIDRTIPNEVIRVEAGTYVEALTINKPLEILAYFPSKSWGELVLESPTPGMLHGITVTGLAPSDLLQIIGFRFDKFKWGVTENSSTGGTLRVFGCRFDPEAPRMPWGVKAETVGDLQVWSSITEEQDVGVMYLGTGCVEMRGCTSYDCGTGLMVPNATQALWRDCIFHNAGTANRHVNLGASVGVNADFNLYSGASPTTSTVTADAAVNYNTGNWATWTGLGRDANAPATNPNGSAGFVQE